MMDAMAELCAEQGYEATKIADIVSRAGVARKTLYDNFDGKEELFLARLRQLPSTRLARRIEAACEESGRGLVEHGSRPGLAALPRLSSPSSPRAARLCLVEAVSATPASVGPLRRRDGRVRRAAAGRSAPADSGLPETIEESLVGGVAWILHQRIRRGRGRSGSRSCCRSCPDFLLSPYRGVSEVRVVTG